MNKNSSVTISKGALAETIENQVAMCWLELSWQGCLWSLVFIPGNASVPFPRMLKAFNEIPLFDVNKSLI